MTIPAPQTLLLADGRVLAYDTVGDPDGVPVLFVHGMPDSRLSRHPDDGLAAAAGVQLVAVDRPGYGRSSLDPNATVGSVARDLLALADHLSWDRFGVFTWSAGTPYGLALAAIAPQRVAAVAVAAGLAPRDGRDDLQELLEFVTPRELADEATPLLVPDPATLDYDLAVEHLADSRDPVRGREVAAVEGAEHRLALSLLEAVRGGLDGLHRDLEVQASEPDVDLVSYPGPVTLLYGERDSLAPPSFGAWWAERLPDATLTVEPGGGHTVALTHWTELLEGLAAHLRD